jgi:branched-chain amino acid transport system ATP-binding protein
MTTPALLEVEDLHVAYGKVEVVHGVSLRVHAGEFVTLLGRNGAGKSTMLKALSGLMPKRAGTVRFAGRDITAARPRDIVRAGLSQVLEGHRVFGPLTVEDNLRLGLIGARREVMRSRLERSYSLFPEMAERRQTLASRLSGGQQQILAVAQGLIAEPRLLMLDEPSFGLAPVVIDRILDVADALCRAGLAVLLVEQVVEQALQHADSAILMETGRVVHAGPAAGLLDGKLLADSYLGGDLRAAAKGESS